jgi:hypothetical protein
MWGSRSEVFVRIMENSARRLVLYEQTVWISVVCVLAAMVMLYQSWASHRWGGLVSAGFFALFALISLRTSRAQFDKHARVATLDKMRIFKRSSFRLLFDEISDVVIETDGLGDGPAPSCRLSLQTNDGSRLLTDGYSSGYGNYVVMRFAILETLGRPVSDAVDQSLRELIRSRRTIDAISLLRSQKNMDLTAARERVVQLRRELARKD